MTVQKVQRSLSFVRKPMCLRFLVVVALGATPVATLYMTAGVPAATRAISPGRMCPVIICVDKNDACSEDGDELAKEAFDVLKGTELSKELLDAWTNIELKQAAAALEEDVKKNPGAFQAWCEQYGDLVNAVVKRGEKKRSLQEQKLAAMGKSIEAMELSESDFFEAIEELIAIKDAAIEATDIWIEAHPEVLAKLASLECATCLGAVDKAKMTAWKKDGEKIKTLMKAKKSLILSLNLDSWPRLIDGWKE